MTLGITTLNLMGLIMTLSLMTLGITKLSIMGLSVTLSIIGLM